MFGAIFFPPENTPPLINLLRLDQQDLVTLHVTNFRYSSVVT